MKKPRPNHSAAFKARVPWKRKGRAREVARPERHAMIERGAEVAVKRQAELLGLSRLSVYYTPRALSERDLLLMRHDRRVAPGAAVLRLSQAHP